MKTEIKQQKRKRRHKRVRAKIGGTARRPRLSVFRSNKHIYAQLIDDEQGHALITVSDLAIKPKKQEKDKGGRLAIAFQVGRLIAQKARDKNITQVVFDRGGYKYHGRVKALAEGAREEGLQF